MEAALEIGKKIEKLRIENAMTQSNLAKALGCSQKTLASWENGKILVPTIRLIQLKRIFRVDLGYFDPDNITQDPLPVNVISVSHHEEGNG